MTSSEAPRDDVPVRACDMPEAEKIAAQWEARHDLAARGRAPDPMYVQHYLAKKRSQEALHATTEHSTTEHGTWRRWVPHRAAS